MELNINSVVLSKLLQRVAGIKPKAGVMPILTHVLLEAKEDGRLVVSASDLEVGKRVTCEEGFSIDKPGSIAVRGDQLREIVKSLPGEEARLKVLDNLRLEIVSGDFVSKIGGRSSDEFPAMDSGEKGMKSFSLHADDLAAFIGACAYSMSSDEVKYHLCGIYLHREEGGNLVAASTDGRRLSVAARQLEDMPAFGVIVPRKGVDELLKLDADHVGLHVGSKSLEVVQGGTFISIRLVDGDFPDYRRGIPSGYTDYCTVDRCRMIEAVNRVRLFSAKNNSIVLGIGGNSISLGASRDNDEGADSVLCETKGKDLTIKVDARYLVDTLVAIEGAEVVMKYGDEGSPLIVLPADYGKWDERVAVMAAMRL